MYVHTYVGTYHQCLTVGIKQGKLWHPQKECDNLLVVSLVPCFCRSY